MPNYFVDSTTGNDGDSGLTMDLAWATLKHALETGGLSAGDIVWVRRIHSETPTSDIGPAYDGAGDNPIYAIGWPRNSHSITSSDWTNGSTSVNVDDNDMDREKHCGRCITAPDGEDYFITRVVDSSTIIIDREYAGSTASNQGATIKADEDYDLAQTIDDSGWTIKKSDYNGDADDLPVIDFDDGNYEVAFGSSDYYHVFKNLELKDSTDASGIINIGDYCGGFSLIGCLLKQSLQNDPILRIGYGTIYLERVILEGSGSGSSQNGILWRTGLIHMKNVAIYNCGDNGIAGDVSGTIFMENVNIGVEIANGDDDIAFGESGEIYGRDVKLGGTNGDVYLNDLTYTRAIAAFENYGKVLGVQKSFTKTGKIEKVTAGSGTPVPNQRSGGAADLIQIAPDGGANFDFIEDWAVEVFCHEFYATTDQKSYRYYVQTMVALSATELWLKLEYIKKRDDDSEYVIKEVKSDEACTVRDDLDDWDQYIEVPSITPAVAGKLRIKCFVSKYDASNKIYIDPKVVIS